MSRGYRYKFMVTREHIALQMAGSWDQFQVSSQLSAELWGKIWQATRRDGRSDTFHWKDVICNWNNRVASGQESVWLTAPQENLHHTCLNYVEF